MLVNFLRELEDDLRDIADLSDEYRVEVSLLDLARKVAVELERLRFAGAA